MISDTCFSIEFEEKKVLYVPLDSISNGSGSGCESGFEVDLSFSHWYLTAEVIKKIILELRKLFYLKYINK